MNYRSTIRQILVVPAFAFLILAVFSLVARAAQEVRDPHDYFFSQTLGDLAEELELAKEQGKKGLLIFFEMDECPFCRRMEETVLNRADVQDWYQQHFLCLTVDIEGDTEISDFEGNVMAEKDFAFKVNRVRATPVLAFFDLQGKRVARYTGATRDAEEFMWLGEFVAEGHYKTTNFTRYKRSRRAEAKTSDDATQ